MYAQTPLTLFLTRELTKVLFLFFFAYLKSKEEYLNNSFQVALTSWLINQNDVYCPVDYHGLLFYMKNYIF